MTRRSMRHSQRGFHNTNSLVTTLSMPSSERYATSPKGKRRSSSRKENNTGRKTPDANNNQKLIFSPSQQKRSTRKVSFVDEITVKEVKRISIIDKKDCWYTVNDMDRFRCDVLDSKHRRFGAKLKSARCHNHMRRVLLHHRAAKYVITAERVENTCCTTRNIQQSLSSVAIKSSKKSKEKARTNANKLEQEVVEDESYINTQISGCFGRSHRWVADYYLGAIFDTLIAAISCGSMCRVI
jgi:hypothetical protein